MAEVGRLLPYSTPSLVFPETSPVRGAFAKPGGKKHPYLWRQRKTKKEF